MSKVKFKITKDGVSISRQQALSLLDGLLLYDMEGRYDHRSDSYMFEVLRYLKHRRLIDDYEWSGEVPETSPSFDENIVY